MPLLQTTRHPSQVLLDVYGFTHSERTTDVLARELGITMQHLEDFINGIILSSNVITSVLTKKYPSVDWVTAYEAYEQSYKAVINNPDNKFIYNDNLAFRLAGSDALVDNLKGSFVTILGFNNKLIVFEVDNNKSLGMLIASNQNNFVKLNDHNLKICRQLEKIDEALDNLIHLKNDLSGELSYLEVPNLVEEEGA